MTLTFFITLSCLVGCDQYKSGWLPFPLEARLFHLGAADSALFNQQKKYPTESLILWGFK